MYVAPLNLRLANYVLVLFCLSLNLQAQDKVTHEDFKKILSNTYVITALKVNGVEVPATTIVKTTLKFNEDGSYMCLENKSPIGGAWRFFEDRQYLLLDNAVVYERYKLLSLSEEKFVISGAFRWGHYGYMEMEYSKTKEQIDSSSF